MVIRLRQWCTVLTVFPACVIAFRPLRRTFKAIVNRRLIRAIVLVFLVYTGIDLLNPQLCDEEFARVRRSIASSVNESAPEQISASIKQPFKSQTNQETQGPTSQDGDCFCCCAHVLPCVMFHPAESSAPGETEIVYDHPRIPSPFLQSPYHPPRFA